MILLVGRGYLGTYLNKNLENSKIVSRFAVSELEEKINTLVYTSWDTAVDDWETEKKKFHYQNSILPLFDSIDFANKNKAMLIFISSDFASSNNNYGLAKQFAEEIVKQNSEKYFILQVSDIFGPGKTYDYPAGAVDRISNPTYVDDIKRFIEYVNSRDLRGIETIKIGCEAMSRWEFMVKTNKKYVEPKYLEEFNLKAQRPYNTGTELKRPIKLEDRGYLNKHDFYPSTLDEALKHMEEIKK